VLRNSAEDWREKQFVHWERDLRRVGTTLQVNGLEIATVVVENNLGGKVEETG
jgi:hypothetical protein